MLSDSISSLNLFTVIVLNTLLVAFIKIFQPKTFLPTVGNVLLLDNTSLL